MRSRAVTPMLLCLLLGTVPASCAGEAPAAQPDTSAAPSTIAAGTLPSSPSITVPLPTDSPSTVAPTSPKPTAIECVATLPIAVRAGQVVWPAVYGDELRRRAAEFADWGVGGAVLMNWTSGSTAADLSALKTAGSLPLLIATDEEGGTVQRLDSLGALPSATKAGASMTAAEVEQLITRHAVAVRALGIDIVFAPVVDVGPPAGTGPIGSRVYGNDPAVVSDMAAAVVRGWQSVGILPVLKHFPGHGSASADTHDRGATTAPLDALRARDMLPYAALATTGAAVMVGHLDVPGLTDAEGVPASLSRAAITDLLRGEYGYANALVFTDALGMKAVTNNFSVSEAAERAIGAGADVVIFVNTDDTDLVIERLVDAVATGRLSAARLDDAVARVLATKHIDPCSLL